MVSFPPCKINLGLNVTGKREDGYHDVVTCFYPVPWTDVLEVIPADHFSFAVSGTPIPGTTSDNLCVRAYALLRKEFDIGPVAMHLLKCLPMGAGLGGGSANGAYTLKALNNIFNLDLDAARLKALAGRLGSDCAFFIDSTPAIGHGRGEVLSHTDISLKGKFIVIVKPDLNISTAEAYAGVTPHPPGAGLADILEKHAPEEWKYLLRNDFEPSIFKRFPVVATLQQKLYAHGAVYASMSGSGSAVYGLFHAQIDLRNVFEGVTYWSGVLE